MARRQITVERRFVVEYVNQKFPANREARFNVAIGPPPAVLSERYPGANPKAFQKWRRYVDAVVILPDKLFIIEAKVWHPKTGISDLLEYRELVPQTTELLPVLNRPVSYVLAVPYWREVWVMLAQTHNITIDLFQPQWIIPHLKRRNLI